MKKVLAITIATCFIVVTSCKKIASLVDIKFSIPYTEVTDVPGLPDNPFIPPTGLTASIPPVEVETKSEEYLKEYNTSSDLVREVKLEELILTIEAPESGNFDLVDSLWLYISATGQPEVLAAYKYGIPKGIKTLSLDMPGVELKDHFLADKMSFRLKGHFYSAPDSTTRLKFFTKFNITANPLYK